MRSMKGVGICLVSMMTCLTPSQYVLAAAGDITFQIMNDATGHTTTQRTGNGSLSLPTSETIDGMTINLSKISSSYAQIFCDDGAESGWIKNLKISTSNPPLTDLHFIFTCELSGPPNGTVNYEVRGGGQLKRGSLQAAQGGKLFSRGSVEAPVGTGLGSINTLAIPPATGCPTSDVLGKCVATTGIGDSYFYWSTYATNQNFAAVGTNPRKVKGEFWLTLTSMTADQDYLQWNYADTAGLRIKGTPAGAPPTGEECDTCEGEACDTCLIGGWRCKNWWCEKFGWLCPKPHVPEGVGVSHTEGTKP